jgi:16S rRNA (adenine1518-N6/adenine1519-N6)-dimethyltransferase
MITDVTSPKAAQALMEKHGVAPLKRFGQNFLTDANIAEKIAAAAVPEGASALEIGAGLGALTKRLAKRASKVVSYEIDSGLIRALGESLDGVENVKVIHQDFLKADIEKDLPPLLDGDIYVAANLPYYITTDCIMKLLTAKLPVKSITVMVQKEFAARLFAQPCGEGYGALNAAVGYYALAAELFDVSASRFLPVPEVSSAVIRLDMRGVFDTGDYLKTVKGLFAAKRKTVKNNLRHSFSLSQDEAETVLKQANIDENARAQNLSVKDYLNITENIKKIKNM